MYGSDFMVRPVVNPGHDSVDLYLPKGTWINVWTQEQMIVGKGKFIKVDAPMGKPPMFFKKSSKHGKNLLLRLKAAGL